MRMNSSIRRFLIAAGLVGGSMPVTATDFDSYLTGNAADVKPAHTEGALMLMGGGGSVDDAFRWFIQKAGGGDIVVLKATDRDEPVRDTYGAYLHGTIGGCDSVEVIAFNSRAAASDAKVSEIIRNADGIFMGGGKQFLYADYWKGTPVGAALDAHVRAGRPLGGSSAGLAVLGQYCYTAHVTARLTSDRALKDPFDKALTLEDDFLHLDLMRGVITDTHFTPRGRLGRLITFVARIGAEDKVESLLGIGVDEKTALCVGADGSGQVFTAARDGRAWFVMPQRAPEILAKGKPLTFRDVKVVTAGPHSAVALRKRVITQPLSDAIMSVIAGELAPNP